MASDDLMDLGPFMKEYVLVNPFTLPRRTSPSTTTTPVPSPTPSPPKQLSPIRTTESPPLENPKRTDVISPLLGQSKRLVESTKAYIGSNASYASKLRGRRPSKFKRIKNWYVWLADSDRFLLCLLFFQFMC